MAVNFWNVECGHANERPKHEQGALTYVNSMAPQDFAPLAPKLTVGLCTFKNTFFFKTLIPKFILAIHSPLGKFPYTTCHGIPNTCA